MMQQTTGLKRNPTDKYYTSKTAVKECMKLVNDNIEIGPTDLCIEPSAGNGSFIDCIKTMFTNYKFYDLEPDNTEIIKQDYLTFDYSELHKECKIHIIGNPPFGRQSSLAIKFIKKSCNFADTVSFILPKSFKKDSLKRCFPLNFHLETEYDLPNDSFLVDDKSYNVPCVFQIWVKNDTHRVKSIKHFPNKYQFVKKDVDHDISFRRVGNNAGDIDRTTEQKSEQSHYFIKFDNVLTYDLFDKLSNINYSCKDNTVGPRSISKQELMKEFNKFT
tara:strand:+ start:7269 stop:8090 length:822 start_codon:yes stop_codon:yes gene_type:complete